MCAVRYRGHVRLRGLVGQRLGEQRLDPRADRRSSNVVRPCLFMASRRACDQTARAENMLCSLAAKKILELSSARNRSIGCIQAVILATSGTELAQKMLPSSTPKWLTSRIVPSSLASNRCCGETSLSTCDPLCILAKHPCCRAAVLGSVTGALLLPASLHATDPRFVRDLP